MNQLYVNNTPDTFWRPIRRVPDMAWQSAANDGRDKLPAAGGKQPQSATDIITNVLNESVFGELRYQLSPLKSLYYAVARPILPAWVRPMLRKVYQPSAERTSVLEWPIEDRFVSYQFATMAALLDELGRDSIDILGLWPEGYRAAFVLTHDVEAAAGRDFVLELAALEEKYGFRSSFNFVPEAYQTPTHLMDELRERGFEVGVHGLNHDGRLFSSRSLFEKRAKKINSYVKQWNASGFRSPMTHRNPEWMQSLAIEYDSSFFDTDPYEPMAGGTMCIWPFFIGRFVELPYTVMQDHTYLQVLGERTPDYWLSKVDFVIKNYGMVLMNSHPDYLMKPDHLPVYESFLARMQQYSRVWHALPSQVASWWRTRAELIRDGEGSLPTTELTGSTIWTITKDEQETLGIHIPQLEVG